MLVVCYIPFPVLRKAKEAQMLMRVLVTVAVLD